MFNLKLYLFELVLLAYLTGIFQNFNNLCLVRQPKPAVFATTGSFNSIGDALLSHGNPTTISIILLLSFGMESIRTTALWSLDILIDDILYFSFLYFFSSLIRNKLLSLSFGLISFLFSFPS